MKCIFRIGCICVLLSLFGSSLDAKDQILVIGGGYSPTGNQASLEKNVLFFQRLVEDVHSDSCRPYVLFADGTSDGADLQVNDPDSVPRANRLMAEFFGSEKDIGMHYRSHAVADVRGASTPRNLEKWFDEVGTTMEEGDRLLLYVTAHGGSSKDRSDPYNTTIYMWNNGRITVQDLIDYLDDLPEGVSVVSVMVQCHAGGFARYMFDDTDDDALVARQNRCGFFATVHSRSAAGCTPDIDEADYQEYSTYFWAAIGGKDRLGRNIEPPDYNEDGMVSFDEAHAYTIIHSNTIDLPIRTSGEFLRLRSRFGNDKNTELLDKDCDFSVMMDLANPVQRVVLERLSEQLGLDSEDRLDVARKRVNEGSGRSSSRGRYSRRRPSRTTKASQLKSRIAGDVRRRWPELANVLSPVATELLTTRRDEFVDAIESHPVWEEYVREKAKEQDAEKTTISPDRMRVKYERLLREAENVILAHNLTLIGDEDDVAAYQRIVASEQGVLAGAL